MEWCDKIQKCTDSQRAVWRKRGSGSPESLCEFSSFAPVRTVVEAPPAPSRWDVACCFGMSKIAVNSTIVQQ